MLGVAKTVWCPHLQLGCQVIRSQKGIEGKRIGASDSSKAGLLMAKIMLIPGISQVRVKQSKRIDQAATSRAAG
jgi:hypothetical protein